LVNIHSLDTNSAEEESSPAPGNTQVMVRTTRQWMAYYEPELQLAEDWATASDDPTAAT